MLGGLEAFTPMGGYALRYPIVAARGCFGLMPLIGYSSIEDGAQKIAQPRGRLQEIRRDREEVQNLPAGEQQKVILVVSEKGAGKAIAEGVESIVCRLSPKGVPAVIIATAAFSISAVIRRIPTLNQFYNTANRQSGIRSAGKFVEVACWPGYLKQMAPGSISTDGHQPAIESRQHARNVPPAVISSSVSATCHHSLKH